MAVEETLGFVDKMIQNPNKTFTFVLGDMRWGYLTQLLWVLQHTYVCANDKENQI